MLFFVVKGKYEQELKYATKWNYYSDTSKQLSFRYPPAYDIIKHTLNSVTLVGPLRKERSAFEFEGKSGDNDLVIEIDISPSSDNDSLERFMGEDPALKSSSYYGSSPTNIMIDKTPGKKVVWTLTNLGETIYVIKNMRRYRIVKKLSRTNRDNEYQIILNSLRFEAQNNVFLGNMYIQTFYEGQSIDVIDKKGNNFLITLKKVYLHEAEIEALKFGSSKPLQGGLCDQPGCQFDIASGLDVKNDNGNVYLEYLPSWDVRAASYKITIPQLAFVFELPSTLSACGAFTIDFEQGSYERRTIRSAFTDFSCSNNFFLNAYSVSDTSGMRNMDIFMNIQGYILKNKIYSYLRYYDGTVKETPISPISEPQELESAYGVKMLKVKGVGQLSKTELPLIGGLVDGQEGIIIMTGNPTYPAFTLTVDLVKIRLTEDELNKILLSFRKL